MHAPMNSARSVATATHSACTHRPSTTGRRKFSLHRVARSRPVARPVLADRYWMNMATRQAATSTQASK